MYNLFMRAFIVSIFGIFCCTLGILIAHQRQADFPFAFIYTASDPRPLADSLYLYRESETDLLLTDNSRFMGVFDNGILYTNYRPPYQLYKSDFYGHMFVSLSPEYDTEITFIDIADNWIRYWTDGNLHRIHIMTTEYQALTSFETFYDFVVSDDISLVYRNPETDKFFRINYSALDIPEEIQREDLQIPEISPRNNVEYFTERVEHGEVHIFRVATPPEQYTIQGNNLFEGWSPQQEWLIYRNRTPDRFAELYLVRHDGVETINISQTPNLHDYFQVWHPRRDMLVWSTFNAEGEGDNLFASEPDGTHRQQLTHYQNQTITFEAWVPDFTQQFNLMTFIIVGSGLILLAIVLQRLQSRLR